MNLLESRTGSKTTYLDSAVAVTPDGAVNVLYCDRRAGSTLTDALYRRSLDGSGGVGNWSEPLRIGDASPTWCNNVCLKAAPDSALLVAWTGGNPDRPEVPDSFVRVWRRSPNGEWTDISPPRVTGGQQFESDISFLGVSQSHAAARPCCDASVTHLPLPYQWVPARCRAAASDRTASSVSFTEVFLGGISYNDVAERHGASRY